MKVVHVFWGLTFGGIETMLVNIANAQVKEGADVSVIIVNDLKEDSLVAAFDSRIHLYWLHRKIHSKNPLFIYRLNKVLRQINPNAIHLHSGSLYRMIFSRRLSRVATATLHDLPTGSVRRSSALHALPMFDISNPGNVTNLDIIPKVFAISEAVKDALWEKYHIDSTVVNNGILTSKFQPRTATAPHTPLRIVQVSRLEHDKKGQDLLIEATARLAGKIDVTFIGDGSSKNLLQQLAKDKGVSEYVHFLGKQQQDYIATHLNDYDLFVQASRYEGFGLTVAEAMAANVPVLVSAGQGPAEVTCGDTYGWTFENGSVADLADKISYILEHYPEASEKAKRAKTYVVEHYDVSATAKKYLEHY